MTARDPGDNRVISLINYLFALELRRAHYSQADVADILMLHERAHTNGLAVLLTMGDAEIDRLIG